MGATETDLRIGRDLALKLVAAGLGRVRRVLLFGSRARGTARQDSDFDLMLVLETPDGSTPWGPAEAEAERQRLLGAVRLRVQVDLSVRSTDRYEEARRVVGGLEYLCELEGVTLYSHPLERPPVVTRSPEQVRDALVATWIAHAWTAFEQGLAMETPGGTRPYWARSPVHCAEVAVKRSITALLVLHGVLSFKHDGVARMLARLAEASPGDAALLRAELPDGAVSHRAAHAVIAATAGRLDGEPGLEEHLAPLHENLARPVEFPAAAARRTALPVGA